MSCVANAAGGGDGGGGAGAPFDGQERGVHVSGFRKEATVSQTFCSAYSITKLAH
jgi:hypothetical protein